MPNVKDPDPIIQDAIEDLIWIPDQRKHANSGQRVNAWCRLRTFCDEIDNVPDTGFKRQGNEVTKRSATIG